MTPEQRKELDAYRRRSERDRRAQESAQRPLEELSRDLHEANERLKLASRGRLEALTREGDAFRFAATQNDRLAPDRSDALGGRVPSDHLPIGMRSIAGAAAISGTLIAVTDAHHLPDNVPHAFDRRFEEATGYRTRSGLAVSLKGQGGEVMGVLQRINRLDPRGQSTVAFDEDDPMLMRHFAGIASVSMERARLTRSIITRMIRSVELRDPLETGTRATWCSTTMRAGAARALPRVRTCNDRAASIRRWRVRTSSRAARTFRSSRGSWRSRTSTTH